MRNYFILNGVDSRDFGVYISGQGTYSAPQKAYTFYNVPGRNGAILGNENRLENINVSYEAFIYADFDNNIANFRTFLLSLNGYQKLSDSYHPDEYRYAVYQGPFEPKVTKVNDAGSFVITFSCKPQRYLTSGDTVYDWQNQEISGSVLTIDATKVASNYLTWRYTAHAANISSGVTGGAGWTFKVECTDRIMVYYLDQNGVEDTSKRYSSGAFGVTNHPMTQATANLLTGSATIYAMRGKYSELTNWTVYSSNDHIFRASIPSGSNWSSLNYALRMYQKGGSTFPSDYEYAVKTSVSNLTQSSYSICISGGYFYIRDIDFTSADTLKNSRTNCEFDVNLSSPVSASFTAYVPQFQSSGFFTLKGANPSYETFTVKYISSSYMSNPTEFPSSPLIRAYGNGVFEMDGITITITNATSYTDIDCDLMDCYEGSTNRNNDVSFSTYDFPLLRPGDNAVSITSGITALEITPRWWRV